MLKVATFFFVYNIVASYASYYDQTNGYYYNYDRYNGSFVAALICAIVFGILWFVGAVCACFCLWCVYCRKRKGKDGAIMTPPIQQGLPMVVQAPQRGQNQTQQPVTNTQYPYVQQTNAQHQV